MRNLTFRQRVMILIGIFILTLVTTFLIAPIPQDPGYHAFVDMRSFLGIPNFGDVVSNAGFMIVGVAGLLTVLGNQSRVIFDGRLDALPYLIFFIGVGLVSIGSSYYHLVPDNDRLFWDRLPMTISFMALFSAIVADRINKAAGVRWLLPVLIALGIASLLYWDWTEAQGRGDLRFYGLVQFYPMIALPIICWLFPKARFTGGGYLVWVIFWYAAAKLLEYFDSTVLSLSANLVSGHSLKHLAAAIATYMVLKMIKASSQQLKS